MRTIKKIAGRVLLLLCFCWILNSVSYYVYESVYGNTPVTREEIKDSIGTVETLLLGTSLVHMGLKPSIMDERLDTVTLNLGSSGQDLSGTYYLLKDQVTINPLRRVFLGVNVTQFCYQATEEQGTSVKLGVYDRILSPLIKAQMLIDTAEFAEYEKFLFYPARVSNIFNRKLIVNNLKYKASEAYENRMSPKNAHFTYGGMGFETSSVEYDGSYGRQPVVNSFSLWGRERVIEGKDTYFKKILSLCQSRGIECYVVVVPHAQDFAQRQGDMLDFHQYLEELCEETQIPILDFNEAVYENFYDTFPYEYYYDKKHMNEKGAEAFTELLCQEFLQKFTVEKQTVS